MCKVILVVATQIFVIFTPNLGEDEPNLTNIFEMGWFNHQPVIPKYPPQKDNKKTPFPTKRGTPGTYRLKVSAG